MDTSTILLTLALALLIYLYIRERKHDKPLKELDTRKTNWEEYEQQLDEVIDFKRVKITPLNKEEKENLTKSTKFNGEEKSEE